MKKNSELILNNQKYIILDKLGEGGAGEVYKVKSEGELFALKLVVKKPSKTKLRFIKECEFSQSHNNENIIKYIHHGYVDKNSNSKNEILYALMPLYDSSLRSFMESKPSDLDKIEMLIQICDSLKFIHSNNIIHRDIKPENILISNENKLVLADFGIAQFENSEISESGDRLANFKYRAPEQIEKGQVMGTYTDIYALGLIINEFFTDNIPQGINFINISDVNIIYKELDNLVKKMIKFNIHERISNIDLVKYELEGILIRTQETILNLNENLYTNYNDQVKINDDLEKIFEISTYDILLAKHLLYYDKQKLYKSDSNYNMRIGYTVSNYLLNLTIQNMILSRCQGRFEYESNTLKKVNSRDNIINYTNQDESLNNKKMIDFLEMYPVNNDNDLSGKILKYFFSCAEYEKESILKTATEYVKRCEENLLNAPILWIIKFIDTNMKYSLERMIDDSYEIEYELFINWEETVYRFYQELNFSLQDEYKISEQKEIFSILEDFKEKIYNIEIDYVDELDQYVVYFEHITEFIKFKEEALFISKSDYFFEGDVIDLLGNYTGTKSGVKITMYPYDIKKTLKKLMEIMFD